MAKFKSGDLVLKTNQKIILGNSDESYLLYDADNNTLKIVGTTTFSDNLIQGNNLRCCSITYLLYNITTNNEETELLINGKSKIDMPNNSMWVFSIVLTGRSITNEKAAFEMKGMIDKSNEKMSVIGNLIKDVIYRDIELWDVTVNVSRDSLAVKVMGEEGKTIHWTAKVEIVQM